MFSCYGNTDPFSLHDSFRLEMSTVQTDASDLMLCPLARESLVHSALWTPHLKPIQDPAACPELCALPATSGGEGEAAFLTHCRGSAQGWFPPPGHCGAPTPNSSWRALPLQVPRRPLSEALRGNMRALFSAPGSWQRGLAHLGGRQPELWGHEKKPIRLSGAVGRGSAGSLSCSFPNPRWGRTQRTGWEAAGDGRLAGGISWKRDAKSSSAL